MPLLKNGIVIWSGSTLDIPDRWQLCDGTNNTPDLRNRFIIGAGDLYSVGTTGGSKDTILPLHNHTFTTSTAGLHGHILRTSGSGGTGGPSQVGFEIQNQPSPQITQCGATTSSEGAHEHTGTVGNAGNSNGTNMNLPPYFALCYIMQIV